MPRKKRASTGITPEILLDHMRGMEDRLRTEFKRAIGESEGRLGERIGQVATRLDRMEKGMEWIKVGISNMDERLDDIEVVQIPKLKKAVDMR